MMRHRIQGRDLAVQPITTTTRVVPGELALAYSRDDGQIWRALDGELLAFNPSGQLVAGRYSLVEAASELVWHVRALAASAVGLEL
jgi:hypothetical protein